MPAGARHNVVNTSKKTELRLYTIYSPPEHIDKTIRHTKAQAEGAPEEYDGKTTNDRSFGHHFFHFLYF